VPTYQKALYNALIKHTGLKGNRASPLSKDSFSMTKHITNQRSILIEHGFMDSSVDVPIILTDKFARQCADAHAEWLVATFKLKGGEDMLQRGSKGALVMEWQKFLLTQDYNLGNFGPNKDGADGDFGNATETATMSFLGKPTVDMSDLITLLQKPSAEIDKANAEIKKLNEAVSALTKQVAEIQQSNKQIILQKENEISKLKVSTQIIQNNLDAVQKSFDALLGDKLSLLQEIEKANESIKYLETMHNEENLNLNKENIRLQKIIDEFDEIPIVSKVIDWKDASAMDLLIHAIKKMFGKE
jgi:hypothetical protein